MPQQIYVTRAVYEELGRVKPAGLRYATFKLDDGVSFVHIVAYDQTNVRNPLTELSAFKAFAAGVKERCEEPPVAVELHEIGAYRFFGDDRHA